MSRGPHLADATDLESWAQRVDARYQLGQLLRRLIRKDNDQVFRLEMRAGEGAGIAGYDGVVEAGRATPLVPAGVSVWELGSGGDPREKANDDYRNRTNDSLGLDKSETTFVFVTLRRWDKKVDWASKKRAEDIWKDVVAYDADDLEQALGEAPSVHYWLSERMGLGAADIQTLEDWWDRFSAIYEPVLSPKMVLAGRTDQAADLLRLLSRDVGRTFIRAATVDDGLAFVGATVLSADADTTEDLLAKSLLVYDAASLRRLDQTASLLMLLPYEEDLRRQADLVRGHHVVCVLTDGGDADLVLPPIPHAPFEAELVEAGVHRDRAQRLSRAAHKSLAALRRVASTYGAIEPEGWTRHLAHRAVRRAWLFGSWSAARSGDQDELARAAELSYDAVEDLLRPLAAEADPLFTVVGSSWSATPRTDAWTSVRLAITDSDLRATEAAIQTVLSAVDPRLDLPVEDRWTAALHGKMLVHSNDLRSGLARTLALFGARGDDVRLGAGRTGRLWAEAATSQLFHRANADPSGQLWHSLSDVVPLLAEAAPDNFLRAIDQACSGEEPLAATFFQDSQGAHGLGISSPHTGFLWALEAVAWSPTYFALAVDVTAKLQALDPGGRLSNRPIETLKAIFRPWLPQTSATRDMRARVLDVLRQRHPEVAWDLMIDMLPEGHAVGSYTNRPDFRDWAPPEEESPAVTRDEYRSVVTEVSQHLVQIAATDPKRWPSLLPEFSRLHPASQESAVQALAALSQDLVDSDTATAIWSAALKLVRHHRQYADANWSLSEDVLGPLESAVAHLSPSSPLVSARWLFNDWMPDIGMPRRDDIAAHDAEVLRRRQEAVREALEVDGLEAVSEFARTVELPWSVGHALGSLADPGTDEEIVPLLESTDTKLRQFADAYVGKRMQSDSHWLARWLAATDERPEVQARLLLRWPDLHEAWERADALGEEVSAIYWAEFSPYGRGSDFPELNDAAERLIDRGRAAIALDALSMYADRNEGPLDVEVVQRALDNFGTRDDDPDIAQVSEYDLSRLLAVLRAQAVPNDVVARYEWKFLPILARDGRLPSLERMLASDPREFVNLIEIVFRPHGSRDEEVAEPSEERAAVAGQAWRLLREWRTVPGTREDGTIDGDVLGAWLAEARTLLEQADRTDVGELQIGEVLAHAPADPDGTFPALPVRDALEKAPDDRLGRGFGVGVFNKRGVTSRGLTDGGVQEYRLASQYRDWASAIVESHPRTAALLRSIAESYENDGRREDEEAQRYLEGLDG